MQPPKSNVMFPVPIPCLSDTQTMQPQSTSEAFQSGAGVSASSLFLLFKWLSPLQAKERHVPEKSCINNQTFKFLTAPKVLNYPEHSLEIEAPLHFYSQHVWAPSVHASVFPWGRGRNGTAFCTAGGWGWHCWACQIADPNCFPSTKSLHDQLRTKIVQQWGEHSVRVRTVMCFWDCCFMLRVSHSTCQCFSGPQYPESHSRDVATTDLFQPENPSKI